MDYEAVNYMELALNMKAYPISLPICPDINFLEK